MLLVTVRTVPQTSGPGRKVATSNFVPHKVYYSCTKIYTIAIHPLFVEIKIKDTKKTAKKQDYLPRKCARKTNKLAVHFVHLIVTMITDVRVTQLDTVTFFAYVL